MEKTRTTGISKRILSLFLLLTMLVGMVPSLGLGIAASDTAEAVDVEEAQTETTVDETESLDEEAEENSVAASSKPNSDQVPTDGLKGGATVTLNAGPEGNGKTKTVTLDSANTLLTDKAAIKSSYNGIAPNGTNNQRVLIGWFTGYDSTTSRGTGTEYFDTYTGPGNETLYAIWGYPIMFNANGGTYKNGKSTYLGYVANFHATNYSDPKSSYRYAMPDYLGDIPTKSGCERVMYNGDYAYALLINDGTWYLWEGPNQNLTIPPTGGSAPWSDFKCVYSEKYKMNIPEFWAGWNFTVKYNSNGGTGSMSTDTVEFVPEWKAKNMHYYENYSIRGCTFTKSGASFTGWNTEPDGSGIDYAAGTNIGGQRSNSDSLVLYAQWSDGSVGAGGKYTIKFNGNGGTVSGTSSFTGSLGSKYSSIVTKVPTATREGYAFDGWWYQDDQDYLYNGSDVFRIPKNVTFVAHWVETPTSTENDKDGKYTLTFDPNGGTIVSGKSTYKIDYEQYYHEVVWEYPRAVRIGYTFDGWWYGTSFVLKLDAQSEYYKLKENGTFVAQWEKINHTCSWVVTEKVEATCSQKGYKNSACVCGETKSETLTKSHSYTELWGVESEATCMANRFDIYKCATCELTTVKETTGTKLEHVFSEWADAGNGTSERYCTLEYNCGTVETRKNVYEVQYANLHDGKLNSSTKYSYTFGTALTLYKATRTGYTFDGWYTDAELTTPISTVNPGTIPATYFVPLGEVITLYAKWTPNEYAITYYRSDATTTALDTSWFVTDYLTQYPKHQYDRDTVLPTENEIVRPGWTFKGWYTKTTYTEENRIYVLDGKGYTAAIKLYAYFEVSQIDLKFYHEDFITPYSYAEIAPKFETHMYNAEYTFPAPTKTGYTFMGWVERGLVGSDEAVYWKGTYAKNTGIPHDADLIAQWQPNSYKLTLDDNGGTMKDADGNTITTYAITDYTYDQEYDLSKVLGDITYKGYEADGWTSGTGASNYSSGTTYSDDYYFIPKYAVPVTKATTIYVKWKPNTFKIRYVYDGQVLTEQTAKELGISNFASLPTTHTYGKATTIPAAVRPGYTPGAWKFNDATGLSSGTITKGKTWYGDTSGNYVEIDGEYYIVLTATTSATKAYNITLDTDIANATIENIVTGETKTGNVTMTFAFPYATGYTISETFKLTHADYTFVGWAETSASTVPLYDSIGKIPAEKYSAAKTLFAVWRKNEITITLDDAVDSALSWTDVKAGTTTSTKTKPKITFNTNEALNIAEYYSVSRSGYIFAGWAADGTTKVLYPYDNQTIPAGTIFRADTTLDAVWVKESLSITLTLNSGTLPEGVTSPLTHVYGNVTTLPIPTRDGFTFEGWWTTSGFTEGTGPYNEIGATQITAATTLYARWTKNEIPITYKFVSGTLADNLWDDANPKVANAIYGQNTILNIPDLSRYVSSGTSKPMYFQAFCYDDDWTQRLPMDENGNFYVPSEYLYGKTAITIYVDYVYYSEHTYHTPGEFVIENRIEPTCTVDGSYELVQYCTECLKPSNETDRYYEIENSRFTVIIPATGHSEEIIPAKAPTCTETGLTEGTKCSVCGEIIKEQEVVEALGHTLIQVDAQAATCENIGWDAYEYCSVCDYTTYVEIPALGHEWGETAYEWDEELSCIATRVCIRGCTETEWSVATDKEVLIPATCMEMGTSLYTACFDLSLDWLTEQTTTRVDISVDPDAHAWDEGVVTAPTCTAEGYTTYTCQHNAEHQKVEDIKAILPHTEADAVEENRVEATCTTDGSYESVVYCSVCEAELSREAVVITASGHSYETAVTDPTCTEEGYTTYTCSVCGDTYKDDYVDALGHKYDAVATAPTCTEDGYTTYTCSVCGDSYVDDHVDALGHKYDAVATAPTCTEDGYTTYTCSVCGDSYVDDHVDALGHKYDAVVTAPTCTEDGYTTYTCSVCGDSYVDDEVVAPGHKDGEAVIENDVKATCTTDGSYDTVVYCTVCDIELSRATTVVKAQGHKYDAVITAPTCTEKGYTTYTCSVCGDTYKDDYVDALDHAPAVAVEENRVDAECGVPGSYDMVVYCSRCDAELSRESFTIEALTCEFAFTVNTEDGDGYVQCKLCGEAYNGFFLDEETGNYYYAEGEDGKTAEGLFVVDGYYYYGLADECGNLVCDDIYMITFAEKEAFNAANAEYALNGRNSCYKFGADYRIVPDGFVTGQMYRDTIADDHYAERTFCYENYQLVIGLRAFEEGESIVYRYFNDWHGFMYQDTKLWISDFENADQGTSGHNPYGLPHGYYNFGADGIMVMPEGYAIVTHNGKNYLTLDGVKQPQGIYEIEAGKYVYVKHGKTVAQNEYQWVASEHKNGLIGGVNCFYYFGSDFALEVNRFVEVSGKTYYINEKAEALLGFNKIGEDYYFFNARTGLMYKDTVIWVGENSYGVKVENHYFMEDGKMFVDTGVFTPVLTEENGELYITIDGVKQYYGLFEIDGALYFAQGSGIVARDATVWVSNTNGLVENKGYYHFDADGKMVRTGFMTTAKGYTYYYDNGVLAKGFTKIGDHYYLFNASSGMMYADATMWIGANNAYGFAAGYYYFDAEGKLFVANEETGVKKVIIENGYYYFTIDNVKQYNGIYELDGDYYYAKADGKLYTSTTLSLTDALAGEFGGTEGYYAFGADGKLVKTGFVEGSNGYTYYYDDLVRVKGLTMIGDDIYLFNNGSGSMYRNYKAWIGADNALGLAYGYYYFGADGKCTGKVS